MKKSVLFILMLLLILCFAGCTTAYDGQGQPVSSNDAFNIIDNRHAIRFETNGGSRVETIRAKTLTSAPDTYKEGYVFEGWFMDASLITPAIYPIEVKNDTVLYAKWLRIHKTVKLADTSIKLDTNFENSSLYSISGDGFNLDRLSELGYRLYLTVSYDVYYEKDYNVWWDIGYMGAPKYEVGVLNDDLMGSLEKDITASTNVIRKKEQWKFSISELENNNWVLVFYTDNIQNIIYFENIELDYSWVNY